MLRDKIDVDATLLINDPWAVLITVTRRVTRITYILTMVLILNDSGKLFCVVKTKSNVNSTRLKAHTVHGNLSVPKERAR